MTDPWMAGPSADRRRRTPGVDVILAVAAQLFDTHGYQSVSMQRIAEELSISKPTLYSYVASKADLVRGIVDDWIRSSEEAMSRALEEPTPVRQIDALLRGWTQLAVEKAPSARFFAHARREVPQDEARRYDEWARTGVHRVRALVEEGQRLGEIRPDLNATVITFVLLASVNWTARWFNPDGPLTADDVIGDYWKIHSDGILAR